MEVVPDMTNPDEPRTPQQVSALFDITGREGEIVHDLAECVQQLHQVQAAKEELQQVSVEEMREALKYRRLGRTS